ncbi:hypothetical protein FP804_02800 [archaeon]|nr:hypothetical protein [archaeon]
MWLVVSLVAAISITALSFITPKKYNLGFLSLMLWGLSIMVLIDHVFGYEGGEFLEMETGGLITNGAVLGIVMLIPLFIIWEIALRIPKIKGSAE